MMKRKGISYVLVSAVIMSAMTGGMKIQAKTAEKTTLVKEISENAALTTEVNFQSRVLKKGQENRNTFRASDFTLTLPESWKENYIVKKSKNKKHGSFVAFYSKKCHRQTSEGWLFSVMRYKDKSYVDMPDYEVLGKWNGLYYVAIFPTDVQCEGATKAAQKQYFKMYGNVEKVVGTIKPVKS